MLLGIFFKISVDMTQKKNNLIETAFKKAVNSTGKLRNSTCE